MNHIDIDVDAAAILNSSTIAVKAILDRRKKLDLEGKQDEPLIVLAGEVHDRPSHILHHILVLQGLLDAQQHPTWCLEVDHNYLTGSFFATSKKAYNPTAEEAIRTRDKNYNLSLKLLFASDRSPYAPYSRASLFNFLQNHHIRIQMTDTATLGTTLDLSDPSTKQSLKTCFDKAAANVSTRSELGIQVRNEHMTRKILTHHKSKGTQIIIQQCGRNHVAGNKRRDRQGHHSLSAVFKQANIPVIAMLPLDEDFQHIDIPEESGLADNEKILLPHLPKHRAAYNPLSGIPVSSLTAEIQFRADEASYINTILERMNLNDDCMTLDQYKRYRVQNLTDVGKEFSAWKDEFYPSRWNRIKSHLRSLYI